MAGRAQFRRRKSARLRLARPEPVPRTVAAARRIAARGRQRLQRDRSMKRR